MNTPKKTLTARDLGRLQHALRREIGRMFGDGSVAPDWPDAPPWMHTSSERGALALLAQPDKTAREEHGRWMAEKIAGGWTYGPVRDDARRLHPSIVPFEQLSPGEQLKDIVTVALTRELRTFIDLSGLVPDSATQEAS
jgi:hypothetical protein